jgi:hypothetical protein
MCSNIPEAPACGVYSSQLIRYSRACSFYHDFLERLLLLTINRSNEVKVIRWHIPGWHVLTMINVWTKYSEPSCIVMEKYSITNRIRVEWNIQIKKIIYKKKLKSIINNITKSCILNIKIRPLVTEYALMIKLVGGILLIFKMHDLVILFIIDFNFFLYIIFFICIFHSTRMNLRAMILTGSAGRICHFEIPLGVTLIKGESTRQITGYVSCCATGNTHTIVTWNVIDDFGT